VLNRLTRGDRHGPRSPELHGLLSQLLAYDPDKNPSPGITSAEWTADDAVYEVRRDDHLNGRAALSAGATGRPPLPAFGRA